MKKELFKMKQPQSIQGWEGAGANIFHLTGDVEEILGQAVTANNCLAYLLRRFGHPVYGWDEYKTLAGYTLTTPNPAACLDITIGAKSVIFGYLLSDEMDTVCINEMLKYRTWRNWQPYKRLPQWLKTRVCNWWIKPTTHQLEKSLHLAIADLLRPVPIRSSRINILGLAEDSKLPEVEPSYMAGLGIGTLAIAYENEANSEAWWHLLDSLEVLGGGDFMTGVNEANEILKARNIKA